jgi:hypothetical protein
MNIEQLKEEVDFAIQHKLTSMAKVKPEDILELIAGQAQHVPAGYRLMPVKLLPAIRDALVETGKCFQPEHVWAAVIAAFDRVATQEPAPIQSGELADEIGDIHALIELAQAHGLRWQSNERLEAFVTRCSNVPDEEFNRMQTALAFWLPSVPPEEGPIRDRLIDDVYLLCGADDGSDEPSAEELGWITLAAVPALPAQEQASTVCAKMPCGACVTNVYDAYDAGKRAAQEQAVSVPFGCQIVPTDPTPKMVDATFNHLPLDGESHNRRNRRIYAAMLAAAPTPPQAHALTDAAREVTPMFLLNVALCIEDHDLVATSMKREILAKLHRIAEAMQAERMAHLSPMPLPNGSTEEKEGRL